MQLIESPQQMRDDYVRFIGHNELVQAVPHSTAVLADVDVTHDETASVGALSMRAIIWVAMVGEGRHPVLTEGDQDTCGVYTDSATQFEL